MGELLQSRPEMTGVEVEADESTANGQPLVLLVFVVRFDLNINTAMAMSLHAMAFPSNMATFGQ